MVSPEGGDGGESMVTDVLGFDAVSCPDDEAGAVYGIAAFPERSPGQEATIAERSARIKQEDVEIPVKRPVLEGVVEDQAVRAKFLQGCPACDESPGARQHGNPPRGLGDQDRLISDFPPAHENLGPVRYDVDRGP